MMVHHKKGSRLPDLYLNASKVLKAVKVEKSSLNDLLFNRQPGRPCPRLECRVKAVFSLVKTALQHGKIIEEMLYFLLNQYTGNRVLDEFKLAILLVELLWGKKRLPQKENDLILLLQKNHHKLESMKNSNPHNQDTEISKERLPRFVRVNLLKTSVEEVVYYLRDDGWIEQEQSQTYSDFLENLATLEEPNFMHDYHIPELLVFPSKTVFYNHPLERDAHILLQAKSSCLPAKLLDPPEGSVVLDMCAAPGMKTTHLAAVMNNSGVLHAVERNLERYATLQEMLKKAGVTCAKTYNSDVFFLDPEKFSDVTHILVDPSCSGSGMRRVEIEEKTPKQIQELAMFQNRILDYALSFPSVQRVVYSTCSLNPLENEAVVEKVMKSNKKNFKLVSAWKGEEEEEENWPHRGSTEYKGGKRCMYLTSKDDLTTGFFVAVIQRRDKENLSSTKTIEEENGTASENESRPKKKKKHDRHLEPQDDSQEIHCIEPVKKKTKKKSFALDDENNFDVKVKKSKKSKRKNLETPTLENEPMDFEEIKEEDLDVKSHKKNKKKHLQEESANVVDDVKIAKKKKTKSKKIEENIADASPKKCKKKNLHEEVDGATKIKEVTKTKKGELISEEEVQCKPKKSKKRDSKLSETYSEEMDTSEVITILNKKKKNVRN